jgi:hypothetical protein
VTLLCFVQERVHEDVVDGEWENIANTILEVTTDCTQFQDNVPEQKDPEHSILELVDRRWIQRVATKMQSCSIEEHPEALSVSTISAKMNRKRLLC